jgi:dihydrofolate synthase/folylpolyglutamate synthase
MNHAEAVAYLLSRERLGIKLGLENIGGLVEAMGHPERNYATVLIAGTNGKGSTAALLESILRAAGYRSGRYTSPHLIRLEERMMVSGELITPDELATIVGVVKGHAERLREEEVLLTEPTFFEIVTACALEFFRRKGVEVAVLEVGMGGRWDATNVAPASLTVITGIGMDHERYLGSTLTEIASEKAATIKDGQPVVAGFLGPEPLEVIRAEAARRGSPLFETEKEVRIETKPAEKGQHVRLETPCSSYESIYLPLEGAFQSENLAVAVRASEVASLVGIEVPQEAVLSGVPATVWEARLERVAGRPGLLIDSAHNALGTAALGRYLADRPQEERVLLFALMDDKDPDEVLAPLRPYFLAMVATRPPNRRARNPVELAQAANAQGFHAEAVEPVEQALARARKLAGVDGEVVVAGSTFLAGEVKRLLEEDAVNSKQ